MPTEKSVTAPSPTTGWREARLTVPPSPSWPAELSPQHASAPAADPQAKVEETLRLAKVSRPGTWVGENSEAGEGEPVPAWLMVLLPQTKAFVKVLLTANAIIAVTVAPSASVTSKVADEDVAAAPGVPATNRPAPPATTARSGANPR